MIRFLKNPWTGLLAAPVVLFAALWGFRVPPDGILQVFSFLLFLAVGIAASKYVLRSPALIRDGNVGNDSLNIVGWAVVLLTLMQTQAYRWIFISLGRPLYMQESYWNALIVFTMFFSFVLVAYSTRRTVPRVPGGRISLGGFFVGFVSALGLMLSGAIPAVTKLVVALFQGAVHAV